MSATLRSESQMSAMSCADSRQLELDTDSCTAARLLAFGRTDIWQETRACTSPPAAHCTLPKLRLRCSCRPAPLAFSASVHNSIPATRHSRTSLCTLPLAHPRPRLRQLPFSCPIVPPAATVPRFRTRRSRPDCQHARQQRLQRVLDRRSRTHSRPASSAPLSPHPARSLPQPFTFRAPLVPHDPPLLRRLLCQQSLLRCALVIALPAAVPVLLQSKQRSVSQRKQVAGNRDRAVRRKGWSL